MQNKYQDRGGGQATGLADDLVNMFRGGINGTFGGGAAAGQAANANPVGSTGNISSVLNDILSGGAGKLGGSLADIIGKDTNRQADELRSRFGAGGGVSMGTPAAYGEALLRSESGPKLTQAIGSLQMSALMPILQMMTGLAGKGISQREMTATPSPWTSAIGALAPAAGAFLGGPAGAAVAGKLGGMFGGGMDSILGAPATLGSIGGAQSPFSMNGIDLTHILAGLKF